MGIHLMQPRFPLGRTYATPGALALDVDLSSYLRRHHCGDWGKLAVPAERDNGRPACWGIDIATAHSKQPIMTGVDAYLPSQPRRLFSV